MKFRRHGSKGFRFDEIFESLRSIPTRTGIASLVQKLRDWIGPVGGKRRFRVVIGAALITSFLVGYVIAVAILFPAPIFPRSQDVPRLLGMSLTEAREELHGIGLAVAETSVPLMNIFMLARFRFEGS